MPRMFSLSYALADASPSILGALHLYVMPRMCLPGNGLADASLSLLGASHVLAWPWLG